MASAIPEGDRVLKEIAAFLGRNMRKDDVVARLGGDEFAVFAAGLVPGPALERVLAQALRWHLCAQSASG